MKDYKDIFCKLIDTELDKIAGMPSLNDNALNQLHMLTDTKKNILKIEKLEHDMSMMDGNSYRHDAYSYDNPMGGSYRRMPNSYNSGYSRTDISSPLEAAMRDARNEQEREEIRQIMMRYHN